MLNINEYEIEYEIEYENEYEIEPVLYTPENVGELGNAQTMAQDDTYAFCLSCTYQTQGVEHKCQH